MDLLAAFFFPVLLLFPALFPLLPERQAVPEPTEVHGHLPQVARGARLHKRDPRRQAQTADVAPRGDVVEAVEDEVEAGEEARAEIGGADVAAVRGDAGPWDYRRGDGRSLDLVAVVVDVDVPLSCSISSSFNFDLDVLRGQRRGGGGSHARLGLPDVPGAEEELAVEVGDVDGVHVDLR